MVKKTVKIIHKEITMTLIDRPDEIARVEIDQEELEELKESIKARGLQQAIKVTEKDGRYKIVFGDRRFLACQSLGLKTIMATVVQATEQEVLIDRFIENERRRNLSPLEVGLQYDGMIERLGMKVEQIAKMTGCKPGTIERKLHLLKMPKEFQTAVHKKVITLSVAEELIRCPDDAKRSYFLEMAIEHGITIRVARYWVDEYLKDLRAQGSDDRRGRGLQPAPITKPVYITCELCTDPVEVNQAQSVTVCPKCVTELHRLLEVT